ncbi:phosphatidylglycerol:prolipoprotein diacylglycerol transferase [Clostridium moniliforme]|uniref:Phosphatidylglycerol--prolipoprotein diacylglyceryl transferase n=1 Tax=Clostridium moniliforme TaxID=39489 RepID=A0ABS4F2U8_9CLOT|nr:prolipoprotein diacylglyceryl transferase [Clostridium moniliforme]MBP1890585.1 phosphatidylglycerol:prolipoprotein diacylglycerol transferase [Clostridium moniliforme]
MNNPIAFEIFGFKVMWYGVLIGIGIILAFLLAYINAKRKGLNFDVLIDIFLISFPCAIIGARAYYVIFEWNSYKNNLFDIFNIREGGLAIHGGLIGAFLSAFIYTRVKKIKFLAYADLVAPSIILAQGIGRWGNFMNSEAHGDVVSYEFISKFPKFIQNGMNINGQFYNPTFLYESIWDIFVCFLLVIILYKVKKGYEGIVISSYMILYSVGRFFIEGLRTDSLMFFGLRIAQIISLIGISLGFIFITYIIIKNKK